jgi:hypothetical protein
METIINALTDYLNKLDWTYIFTLMLISHFVIKDSMFKWWKEIKKMGFLYKLLNTIRYIFFAIPKSVRVFIVGVIYAIIIYKGKGYTTYEEAENLFICLTFTMVFHKMLIQKIEEALLPNKEIKG